MKFLVIGCGSIGRRHIGNLKELGHDVACIDTQLDRRQAIEEMYAMQPFDDLATALSSFPAEAVLVCTPNSSHLQIATDSVNRGLHVFVEKPLSHSLENVDRLLEIAKAKHLVILVGCNFRFAKSIQRVKELLAGNTIGNVVSARAEFGLYLPDWRPWQDYRKSYSANRSLGGGALLDCHEIDLLRFLFGEVEAVAAFGTKASEIEIDTEDVAEVILKFRSGMLGNVHLDYVQRSYNRSMEVVGDAGTILWNFHENMVRLYTAEAEQWEDFIDDSDANDMYVAEMEHFARCITGEERPSLDGENASRVLAIILAAKRSSDEGRVVTL